MCQHGEERGMRCSSGVIWGGEGLFGGVCGLKKGGGHTKVLLWGHLGWWNIVARYVPKAGRRDMDVASVFYVCDIVGVGTVRFGSGHTNFGARGWGKLCLLGRKGWY